MKQLQTLSIVSPGFYGLNTQESGSTLSPNFAFTADNAVIDRFGRLGARKGWVMQTDNGSTILGGNPVRFMLEHYNADNSTVVLSAGNHKLIKGGNSILAGAETMTDITPVLYTITDNDWRGASLNDHAVIVQANHEPVVYTESASPVTQTMTDYTGSVQNYGTNYPKNVIAAYGRFWAHTSDTVYWSTDIADATFPCFCGGTSGTLNIASVLPHNVDEITGLAVHNDFLVIFCRNNIVVYSGASNPIGTSFGIQDVISGVGCVANGSIQATGNDLIFLSDTGIRSFGRLMQEKSLPMRDLSKNVRDDLLSDMVAEIASYGSLDHVVSVYSEVNAFYLLSMPSIKRVYVVDLRSTLQDGAARITTWGAFEAYSFLRDRNRNVLFGKIDGIGLYDSYNDDGEPYTIRFLSHYLDMGNPTQFKMLKQVKVVVYGGSQQEFVIKIGTDYSNDYVVYPFVIAGDALVTEYGSSEYGISEYTLGILTDDVKSSVSGAGNILQIGFEAAVDGNFLSVQTLDCFVKTGRNF